MPRDRFILEALVDLPDDILHAPLTRESIEAMMATLRRCGVERVSWIYYGDGHGGYFIPGHSLTDVPLTDCSGEWGNYNETLTTLENPLRVAVEAAHRQGMELYAYYKPYETGPDFTFPEGSPEARIYGRLAKIGGRLSWLDRFVQDHPHLRIQRRTDDLPADVEQTPIHALKLIKQDDAPTRVTWEHLQLWSSALNYCYQPLQVPFTVQEAVEPSSRDVYDHAGHLLTRKGDSVRTLTLSGFTLTERYLLVTTDFTDGPADFSNAGSAMLMALDEHGREIPGVFATGGGIWTPGQINFRTWGLPFDYGWGFAPIELDVDNASGNRGLIAYARGRNAYLGALCETEPAVQAYWLSCIDEMLAAGVDGIDMREENHSTHTDFPEDYGYNPAVLDACRTHGNTEPATIARVRGEAYTDFLRRAKARINAHGISMRVNVQIDWAEPERHPTRKLAFPANLHFDYLRWIDEGLMDGCILRFFDNPFDCLFDDAFTQEAIARCRRDNIPVTVSRYVDPNLLCVSRFDDTEQQSLLSEFQRVYQDERFDGFILYETYLFMRCTTEGQCEMTYTDVERLQEIF